MCISFFSFHFISFPTTSHHVKYFLSFLSFSFISFPWSWLWFWSSSWLDKVSIKGNRAILPRCIVKNPVEPNGLVTRKVSSRCNAFVRYAVCRAGLAVKAFVLAYRSQDQPALLLHFIPTTKPTLKVSPRKRKTKTKDTPSPSLP